MKLLNREPTEEMIKAGREFQGIEGYTACEIRNIYRDMYDAAPDMEPDSYEQVATLQAEIERLEHIRKDLLARNYKLINRDPTEEMIKAGSYVLRNVSTSLTEVYQAMHDAAPAIKVDERDKTILEQQEPSIERFNELGGGEEHNPLERLRFFCSLAMNKQDWFDVEKFFNHIETQHESALKAERINTLKDAAGHFADTPKGREVKEELTRMANALKEQS